MLRTLLPAALLLVAAPLAAAPALALGAPCDLGTAPPSASCALDPQAERASLLLVAGGPGGTVACASVQVLAGNLPLCVAEASGDVGTCVAVYAENEPVSATCLS